MAQPDILREAMAALVHLAAAIDRAEEIQWTPAPTPKSRNESPRRSSGDYSDPVPGVVMDERRLAVREVVQEGSRALRLMTRSALLRAERIDDTVDRWYGERTANPGH